MATAVNYQLSKASANEIVRKTSQQRIIEPKQAITLIYWCFDDASVKAAYSLNEPGNNHSLQVIRAESTPSISPNSEHAVLVFCVASHCDTHFMRAVASFACEHPDIAIVVNCSQQLNGSNIEKLLAAGVAYTSVGPLEGYCQQQVIEAAMAHHRQLSRLHQKISSAEKKLAERKLVDRAKGLLMQHKQINEPQAYKQLQRMAMDKRTSMAVIANQVIDIFTMEPSN